MNNEQKVMQKFPCARSHQRLTDKEFEIRADGQQWPLPHHLGYGKTEQEAWANAAENIRLNAEDFKTQLT